MLTSHDKILTTHVGSLPRDAAVTEGVYAQEEGTLRDEAKLARTIATAVRKVIHDQVDTGIDIVSDGEQSKISYSTYIKHRLNGFSGGAKRDPAQDLLDYPGILERRAKLGTRSTFLPPVCQGEISVKTMAPLEADIDNLKAAVAEAQVAEAFMNSASPGVIALFQLNEHYPTHEDYLQALAGAMRIEYEMIVDSGLLLQIDAPDLGMGRHTIFRNKTDAEFQKLAELHVEVLNHALRNIPADRVRLHICWGNYEGPHHCDIPMEQVLPAVLKAKPQALLFETSNPRHAHEWTVFRDASIPDDKILVPGVIDSTTNFIEHPELVAERICKFADIVGKDRVIAGTDCGFATFAGFGTVDADVVYAKLGALCEGAKLASSRLW